MDLTRFGKIHFANIPFMLKEHVKSPSELSVFLFLLNTIIGLIYFCHK
jgi:hypothetical protein